MAKKPRDKKIGEIRSTGKAKQVEQTGEISRVDPVKPTDAVGGVKGAGAVGKRRPTRKITAAEREQLLRMIDEEADKLCESGVLPNAKREVVKSAVKMAVDASIVDEDSVQEEE